MTIFAKDCKNCGFSLCVIRIDNHDVCQECGFKKESDIDFKLIHQVLK